MNNIHPTVIISDNVKIGCNNTIHPHTIIQGPVEIGDNNSIGPFTYIGCPATDTKKTEIIHPNSKVKIGNNNIIREYSLIEQPCYENITIIEDNVFIMQGVHISHDAHICSNSVITNTSVLAGIVRVLDGANIAMSCTINQYTVIGQYSIVATNSACMKNVKPFSRYIPNKPTSVNTFAINKFGLTEFEKEITDYVLNGAKPFSDKIKSIIDKFEYYIAIYNNRETY